MTEERIKKLKRGDVIRNLASGQSYVVLFGHPERKEIVAVREIYITNSTEWEMAELIHDR